MTNIQISVRLSPALLAKIDTRRQATGRTRNEWIVAALAWAVEQPVRTTTRTEQT